MKIFHALEPRRASLPWGLAYALLLSLTSLYGYFQLVHVPWYIVQVCYVLIIGMGVLWVMLYGELSRIRPSLTMMLLQMAPLLFALAWSMLIWAVNMDSIYVMKRGLGLLAYQLLLMMMVHVAGIMFGPNAIGYTLLGFFAGNIFIMGDVVRRFGPGSFLSSLKEFCLHLEAHGALAAMEVQDLTFAFGAILIYLFFFYQGKHRNWFIALALFFFVLGWKRSAIVGIVMVTAYTFLSSRLSERRQVRFSLLLGTALVLFGFLYVVLIYTDVLFILTERFKINLMGRDKMYQLVDGYYELSLFFPGIGYGKVSTITEANYARAVRGLHSDILRIYIELGFFGYFIWAGLTFVLTYLIMRKAYSARAAQSYLVLALYLYLTYLTDNTAASYHTQVAWHLVPLVIYLEQMEANVVSTTEIGREQMTVWKKSLSSAENYPSLAERIAAKKSSASWQGSRTLNEQKALHETLKKL